jgi:hypothetical protein
MIDRQQSQPIQLRNGCTIGMLVQKGAWLGLGGIRMGKTLLRDEARPILLRIDTPDGILYTDYTLKKVAMSGAGGATVSLAACGRPWGRQEYLDEYDQSQYTIMGDTQTVTDDVEIEFSPVQECMGGRIWQGFDYHVAFSSSKRSIHRIVVDATWELGGSIVGKTVLSQGQCNRPVYRGAKNSVFTTACLKALHLHGSPQGMSFQLAPRGGLIQAFDFQYSREGALLHYWPQMESISSILESPKGSARLHVVDEYRFPLTRRAATTPQRVLFTPGPLAEHEARDLWWESIEKLYGSLRRRYKVREPRAHPDGQTTGSPRAKGGTVMVDVLGHSVESQEFMYALAEYYLPRLARNGIKRFFVDTMSQSDPTEMGMKRKLENGCHGDLHCGSVCCTWRFFPADFWGGIKAWKHLYESGRKLGVQVGSWMAPHLSHNAPIFREHPEWKSRGANSLATGGGYGIHSINAMDWNTGVFDWVLADLRRWQEEGGLDYLWLDSWSNLGLLPVNYANKMRPNWQALSRFCGELSQMGIELAFESLSPFGIMACGFTDLRNDQMEQNHAVAGQNDFGWWVGQEDMLFNVSMYGIHPRERSEDEVFGIKFRAMANRGFIMLPDLLTEDRDMPERHILLHQTYEQVLPHMRTRRLLPRGQGVRWNDGATEIIWAYQDGVIPLAAGRRVWRVAGKDREQMTHDGQLKLSADQVYVIEQQA